MQTCNNFHKADVWEKQWATNLLQKSHKSHQEAPTFKVSAIIYTCLSDSLRIELRQYVLVWKRLIMGKSDIMTRTHQTWLFPVNVQTVFWAWFVFESLKLRIDAFALLNTGLHSELKFVVVCVTHGGYMRYRFNLTVQPPWEAFRFFTCTDYT